MPQNDIPANQRKLADLTECLLDAIIIRNDQMLVLHLLELLVIGHKWLWHIITLGYKKGVPAGTPPVTGLASFCNLFTDFSIANETTFVKYQWHSQASTVSQLYITDKLITHHGQTDHLSRPI